MKAKIFFFILLAGVVISNTTVFASGVPGEYSLEVSSSMSTMTVDQSTSITVDASTFGNLVNTVTLDLVDGNGFQIICGSGGHACSGSRLVRYVNPGNYTITAKMCYSSDPPLPIDAGWWMICSGTRSVTVGDTQLCCVTETTQIQVTPGSPCVTDGICNADCPNNCTINEDPDCGCLGGNSCCGLGCDNASDSDCPIVPTPTTDDYQNPLVANDIVEFIQQILVFIFTALMPLCILIIIVGAYVMLTSGGIPTKFDLGKKIVIWALIGFAIAVISRGIIHLVWLIIGR